MRHNTKIQSRRSRLTLFLATAAAFLLISAAPAFANPTMKVNILGFGGGGGEVTSKETAIGIPGEPPIECNLPVGASEPEGVCETEMDEVEPGVYAINLEHSAGPNSEFLFWEVASGTAVQGCGNEGVNSECVVLALEGEDAEVNVYFACAGSEPCDPKPSLRVDIVEGEGTVASNPAGLICSGAAPKTCEAEFEEGSLVTLTASAAPGYVFRSWKGCDDPLNAETGLNGRQCTVRMTGDKTVGVKFTKTYELSASKAGGLGKVTTSPGGIVCLANCSSSTAAYKEGASVTVTQAPSKHFTFSGWSGDCTGTGACTVTMSADKEVEALFTEDAQFSLSIDKQGGGQASIKSKAVGILCGYTCYAAAADFYSGEAVAISWKLNKGTTSIEWTTGSGTCTGKSTSLEGSCTVTMSSAKSLVAKFE